MTTKEMNEYKRAAKEAMTQNGFKAYMKDMILLETGADTDIVMGIKFTIPRYIMFRDRKTGREYQCYYGKYNSETHSLWTVSEYRD